MGNYYDETEEEEPPPVHSKNGSDQKKKIRGYIFIQHFLHFKVPPIGQDPAKDRQGSQLQDLGGDGGPAQVLISQHKGHRLGNKGVVVMPMVKVMRILGVCI